MVQRPHIVPQSPPIPVAIEKYNYERGEADRLNKATQETTTGIIIGWDVQQEPDHGTGGYYTRLSPIVWEDGTEAALVTKSDHTTPGAWKVSLTRTDKPTTKT